MPRSWWDPNEMKITRWRNLPDGEVDFEQLDVAPIIRELLQQCADYGLTVAETESLLEMVTSIVTMRRQDAALSRVLNAADTRPFGRTDMPAP